MTAEINHHHIFKAVCLQLFLLELDAAILAPFFTQMAIAKGVRLQFVGLVYSIFWFAGIAITLPAGKWLIPAFGPSALIVGSNLLVGITTAAFGILWYVPSGDAFLALALVLRALANIGVGVSKVASYGLLPHLCGPNVSAGAGTLDTFQLSATVVGPVVGTALFTIGGGADGLGYVLPFVSLGVVQFLSGLALRRRLPEMPRGSKGFSVTSFSGGVVVPWLLCFVGGVACEFYIPGLATYLEAQPFNFNTVWLGVVFTATGLIYALFGPAIGRLDDYFDGRFSQHIMAFGLTSVGVAYALTGPAGFVRDVFGILPGNASFWPGIILLSIGCGLCMVPSYNAISQYGKHKDEDDLANDTATLFFLAYNFGGGLGTALGGIMGDAIGYAASCTVLDTIMLSSVALGVFVFAVYATACAPDRTTTPSGPDY